MNVPATLGAFGVSLAVIFGGAIGIGNAVGPTGTTRDSDAGHAAAYDPTHDPEAPIATVADTPGGLSATADGYTLDVDQRIAPLGRPAPLTFRVLKSDGTPVTGYRKTHDRELHLIVVRRDGTGFQHLHPTRDADGRWATPLTLPAAGDYKVYADTTPEGHDGSVVLSADLSVAGDYTPRDTPGVARTATVSDYQVDLTGDLVAGTASKLTLTVRRGNGPVTDLQPYLAAYGHLVSLRADDLAYLHTHPDGSPGDGRTSPGPDIDFYVDVPATGKYLLYLDFQHEGVVRTAAFTLIAQPPAAGGGQGTRTPAVDGPHDTH